MPGSISTLLCTIILCPFSLFGNMGLGQILHYPTRPLFTISGLKHGMRATRLMLFPWILLRNLNRFLRTSMQLWYLWILLKLVCRLFLQLSAAGSCSRCALLAPSWALYFLFLLVISPENTIALYANDCKTSWIIDNPQDHVSFQHDHLCSWSQLNSMDFNIKKCKLMRISRKKQPLDTNLLVHV